MSKGQMHVLGTISTWNNMHCAYAPQNIFNIVKSTFVTLYLKFSKMHPRSLNFWGIPILVLELKKLPSGSLI
jgi:hypothetical protein